MKLRLLYLVDNGKSLSVHITVLTSYPKPNEGDLIYLPLSNSFFELKFVEDEQPFYQLSNLPVYKLNCALFEYNDEDMETGVAAIDSTQAKNAYQVGLDVTVSGW